jgi:predicted MFS family arabinose efflux permease
MCCLTIYLAANIGLATQTNYAALAVLRCAQSSGSSGTIAIASAVVADVSTRAERGKYIGYATMGVTLGPAIGPVLGGLIAQELGWRWIFWILAIFAGFMLLFVVLFFPETCRCVCGDGSVPPPRWNRTIYEIWHQCRRPDLYRHDRLWKGQEIHRDSVMAPRFRARPWNVLHIALQREAGIILLYGAVMYSGYMMVVSTLTSQLRARYGLSTLQIGLCYLPIGIGSLTSRWTMGILLDRNFKLQAGRQGLEVIANRQQNIDHFNIEQARLQITFPFLVVGAFSTIAYAWVMQYQTALAASLVLLFFLGHFTTGTFSSLNTLIVDTNRESPATATASSNLFRCLMGAGATAFGTPMIKRIGIGWTGTFVTGVWIVAFPALYLVYSRGMRWRTEDREKAARRKEERERKADGEKK